MAARAPWEGARFPPRKWQAEYLPLTLEAIRSRKRGVMVACTGSGKSIYQAEIVHQVLQTLRRGWVILVTVPSQDLVEQLAATLKDRCGPANVGRWYGTRKEWARCIVCCLPSLDTFREVLAERSHRVALWIGDECHKCLPYQDTIEAVDPVTRLGCTATPFRTAADEQLAGFDFLIGRYLIGDAIRDGALVPFQVLRFTGKASEVDFDGDCIAMIKAHRDGPGVVDADSIVDAEQFAKRLTEEGLPAAAIHSRQGKTERQRLLRDLQDGRLACLAHVNLLTEGVDLPWLRWLCMRRRTKSPVRIVQQLGRVLRVDRNDPSKTSAKVLDPLDLLGTYGVRTDVELEKLEEAVADHVSGPPRETEPREAGEGEAKVAKAVTTSEAWLADILLVAELAGVELRDSSSEFGTAWRDGIPSSRQLRTLRELTESGRRSPIRYLPESARDGVRAMVRQSARLSRGTVSDLLNLLFGLRRAAGQAWHEQRRRWVWPDGITIPDPAGDLGPLFRAEVA